MSERKYAVIESFEEFEALADWHIHEDPDPEAARLCIPCTLRKDIEGILAALEAVTSQLRRHFDQEFVLDGDEAAVIQAKNALAEVKA